MFRILLPLLVFFYYSPCAYSEQDHASNSPAEQLVFLNWADYMDPALLSQFEALHNIHVKQIHFESDDHRNSMLAASRGTGYDLVIVNEAMLKSYINNGWLASIPVPVPENFQHLDERWINAYPESRGRAVPFFWGTLGIAYRSDLLAKPLTRWADFFQPNSVLAGRIAMMNSSREVMGMALKTLGYSLNSTVPIELKKAAALLKLQLPFVKTYRYVTNDETSSLVSGDVIASMMFNGDALMLHNINENIKYLVPEEGGNLWIDYMAVFGSSRKQQQAWTFINFLQNPKVAAKLSQHLYTATANKTATSYLPAEFLNNATIYPREEVVEKSEYLRSVPPRTLNKINSLFLPIALAHGQ